MIACVYKRKQPVYSCEIRKVSKPISFRVSDEIKTELEMRAKNRRLTVSDYLKEIVAKEFQIEAFKKMQETRESQETSFDRMKEHAEQTTIEVHSRLEAIKRVTANTQKQTNRHNIRNALIANIVIATVSLLCSAYVASKFFAFW